MAGMGGALAIARTRTTNRPITNVGVDLACGIDEFLGRLARGFALWLCYCRLTDVQAELICRPHRFRFAFTTPRTLDHGITQHSASFGGKPVKAKQ